MYGGIYAKQNSSLCQKYQNKTEIVICNICNLTKQLYCWGYCAAIKPTKRVFYNIFILLKIHQHIVIRKIFL